MKYPLTKRQKDCFNFLKKYIEDHNMSPSYRDIMKGANIGSTSGVHAALNTIERRGWIKRLPGAARAININD
jgi:repressor LexA